MTETHAQPMPYEPLPTVSTPTSAPPATGVTGATAATESARVADTEPPPSSRWRRLVLGNPTDPRWVRPTLLALLLGTALLYLWDLGASGWANSFYSAAVQAGTQSWKAFFFGSSDAANFITVDKPPASLWVMGISARIFGVNSWSILAPQALAGVAAVGFLYLTVRRWFSPAAGLIAGAVLALTPVAVLMFRFNNPDALLVLLLVLAAYATTRAIEKANLYWLVLAATLIGTGFLTKMLQAYLVVPAFALAYLVTAPTSVRKRLVHLLLAGVALVVSSGWWVAIVELTPAANRPYIGGSQNNSVLELIWGYNGLGRITGNETGSVGGAPNGAGGSMWGATGWDRMFGSQMGSQISWLLPAALILLVAMVVYAGRAGRSDRLRTAMIIWGGWLLTTALVFSFAQGIIHEYYTVALAPAIAAIVGIGVHYLWEHREALNARIMLAVTLAVTSIWDFVLLSRSADWYPPLRFLILLGGVVAAVVIVALPWLSVRGVAMAAVAAAIIGLAGPTAYALQTASTPHVGSLPTAGPATAGGFGPGRAGPGGAGGAGGGFGPGAGGPGQFGNGPLAGLGQGPGGTTGQLPGGTTGQLPGATTNQLPGGTAGQLPGGTNGGLGGGQQGGAQQGGAGGLLSASTPGAAVTAALQANSDQFTWVAAIVGANSASGYQLASGDPVMAIGGFNGSDPTPTLAQFQDYVAQGKIHYFIAGGGVGGGRGGAQDGATQGGTTQGGTTQGRGGPGGNASSTSSEITAWVAANYTAKTIDGTTMYDLSAPITGSA